MPMPTQCFARAVENVVYLDGDQYRAIDNWLSHFGMVQKKRAVSSKASGTHAAAGKQSED